LNSVVNLLHYDLIQSDFVGMKMAASARAPLSPKKRRLGMLLVLDCENGHYLRTMVIEAKKAFSCYGLSTTLTQPSFFSQKISYPCGASDSGNRCVIIS
jgi:hypothetical protein